MIIVNIVILVATIMGTIMRPFQGVGVLCHLPEF